jgi:hypothetical protein
MTDDLKTIPGIKAAAEAILANDLEGGPIRTTFALVMKFCSLRRPDMSNEDHFNAFVRWLCVKGVAQFKHDIAIAMAGKLVVILIFLHSRQLNHQHEHLD